MKLPGVERAYIDPVKVREYLLSSTHPVGRFKATFFASLGYEAREWQLLAADILALASAGEAVPGPSSAHGEKYEVRGILAGPSGRRARVRTIWIVLRGSDAPRLVTVFPE